MSKLKKLVQDTVKSMQDEINELANKAVAKAPNVEIPKAIVGTALKSAGIKAEVIGEIGYIVKSIRGELNAMETKELDARFKAIGVTGDITALLPHGFTGALLHDLKARLIVTGLFPYKETMPGQYDSVALNGITAYMVSEATDGTDSAESYTTMIYLVKKAMARVQKSYEALDQSLIPLADEVRMQIIDSLARAIEDAVVNGDDSATHMDANVATNSYKKAFKGLRKLAKTKGVVDAGGAAMVQADWLRNITAAQELGGIYLDDQAVAQGNVVILCDQNAYNKLRSLDAFLTREKAGTAATLFGAEVASVFGIPVVQTPFLPIVSATGVVSATATDNTKGMMLLVNRQYFKFFTTGSPLLETQRFISNQTVLFVGAVNAGFSGVFDRKDTDPTTIDTTRRTAVAIINLAR
jgi:HK97 family phage major capsid protein